ncbi:hypothetical protein [Actinomadura harenae]|uniref:Uncharacterized protein n=1 Tax=Actinomadura harenae TaxID=2483351 RepID=A0A3M2MFC3_9ACTN|nr:hypothetical protein [Actinomadura harenae]RMI47335.1 hypothetical protein EBO15_03890 [Actinomadura harenae]
MTENAVLVLAVAALAVYMGMSWERARRAMFDVRQSRRRVTTLRATASRERGNSIWILACTLLAVVLIVRYL